jgi:hypothetical protein
VPPARSLYPTAVAYIDVLGTSAAASEVHASVDFLSSLQDAFERVDEILDAERKLHGLDYQIFSDLICLAAPADATEQLQLVLRAVAVSAGVCLAHGLFLRGGVTYDEFFFGETIVFGQAIVGAHALEQSTTYPRIALSPEAARLALEVMDGDYDSLPLVIDLHDNTVIVDFLERIRLAERRRARRHIQEWLTSAESNDSHRKESHWMAAYYNWSTQASHPLPSQHPSSFSRDFANFEAT